MRQLPKLFDFKKKKENNFGYCRNCKKKISFYGEALNNDGYCKGCHAKILKKSK
jgi:transcription initiation factor IIE alpha subunit